MNVVLRRTLTHSFPLSLPKRLPVSRAEPGEGLSRAVVGALLGVQWLCLATWPGVSVAVLNAPVASLPRTAEAALRQSVPSINPDVNEIQVPFPQLPE